MPYEDLPVAEFGLPGPLRDKLVTAILAGEKTTTSSLMIEYAKQGTPLPRPGERAAVVDSGGNRVAVIETLTARLVRLADIDTEHAVGEGEGYVSVAQWRAGHVRFWQSDAMREALGDPDFTVDDDTVVVAEAFRLVERG
jgi:uncharacterized protein YhfF